MKEWTHPEGPHESAVQSLPSSQFGVPPWHVPFMQTPPTLQAVPHEALLFTCEQMPIAGSQRSSVQGLLSSQRLWVAHPFLVQNPSWQRLPP
jgi:hypothetical protein